MSDEVPTSEELYRQANEAEAAGTFSQAAKLYERADDAFRREAEASFGDAAEFRAEVVRVLRTIHDALSMVASPGGGGLTCSETNAIVGLYRQVGLEEQADWLHEAHVWSDVDSEDEHHDEYLQLEARRRQEEARSG